MRPDLTQPPPHPHHSSLPHCLIAAAIALGRDGILHPAPLVAHVQIFVVVALEISSALHRHLAAWHRCSAKIQVYSSR